MKPLPNRCTRERFLRANGPARCQPRATPWVTCRDIHLSPEGATQAPCPSMSRPFRAQWKRNPKPRAMPWAGICRTDGAEEAQRDLLLSDAFSSFIIHPSTFLPLLRLTAASPDLLTIIKAEGKV